MADMREKEKRFLAVTDRYKDVIAKVCWLYAGAGAPFEDLYQEVLANLWQGLDSFRGESKISTWIYRAALNTCITWHRRNNRHNNTENIDEIPFELADNGESSAEALEQYRQLMTLIASLQPVDKALITLWLDGKSYDEMSVITGISLSNVAVRLHRAKDKLTKMASSASF